MRQQQQMGVVGQGGQRGEFTEFMVVFCGIKCDLL